MSSDIGEKKPRLKGRTAFLVFLGLALAGSVVLYLNFKTVVISGDSMMPTLKDGRKLLVTSAYWLVGPLQREDIVVVKDNNPAGFMIKRIYRMSSEEVEPALSPLTSKLSEGPFRVPQGNIYVLGDNRGHSDDSRKIGPIPVGKVLGKVLVSPF